MALPQILEAEPWLEEDTLESERMLAREKLIGKKLGASEYNEERHSITSSVTSIAKISIYTYLIFKLVSKSSLPKIILKSLKHFAGKYQSISSIILILAVALCGHFKW